MSFPTFRFVHAADLHLDVPFHGVRRAAPAVTRAMAHAPLAAWDALVQLTIEQNAAFLLLSGDICDGSERAVPAHARFLSGLQRLSAHGIRTFIARGSADPADRWLGIHQWPDHVHCFGSQEVESITVSAGGERLATIHGVSYSSDRPANLPSRSKRATDSGVNIGVLYGNVIAGAVTPGEHHSIADLQAAGMDYWALGHAHRHQRLSEGQPWIVYPGTLQGRSLKDDEIGPKGAVVVTVADGMIRDAAHRAIDAVRLIRTQVDVSPLGSVSELRRVLSGTSARLRSESNGRTIVAACDLVGQAQPWMKAQFADEMWDRLLEDLRQENNGGDSILWWDSLSDLTANRELRHQDDVSMYVHRLVEVLRRAPAGLDRLLSDQSAALGAATQGHRSLDAHEVEHLLNRAERVALSLLEREP